MTPTHPVLRTWHTGAAEIGYTDSGRGDTVLLMHGGGFADWMTPLAAELAGFRVIRLVRAGYTGTTAPAGLTVADHAAHAAALLRELGAAPAHVVAHSAGSAVALQLAIDHPGLVRTLGLCEPPLVETLAAPADREPLREATAPGIGTAMAAAARGDLPAAFDTFMTLVCGPGYRRAVTDAFGAGSVEEAANRSGYLFTGEVPAIGGWTLPGTAAELRLPVLLVQGGDSPPPVHRLVSHLAGVLPRATVVTVPGAGHLMPLTHPGHLAGLVAAFCQPAAGPAAADPAAAVPARAQDRIST